MSEIVALHPPVQFDVLSSGAVADLGDARIPLSARTGRACLMVLALRQSTFYATTIIF